MLSLDEQCTAIFKAEGLEGVNRFLERMFPDLAARGRAMSELKATGRWKIERHFFKSEGSPVPYSVFVTGFRGEQEG